jgi:hypothetical protein
MPHAASRCHRDQLVARLEAVHTSIPNAGGPMAETPFSHSQQAPTIDLVPRIDRRSARAAERRSRRLSPTAGDSASGTRRPFECIALLLQGGVPRSTKVFSLSISLMTAENNSEGIFNIGSSPCREPSRAPRGSCSQQSTPLRTGQDEVRSGSGIDLLKDFSEVAREELRSFTTL